MLLAFVLRPVRQVAHLADHDVVTALIGRILVPIVWRLPQAVVPAGGDANLW